jgi:hypothetical protein
MTQPASDDSPGRVETGIEQLAKADAEEHARIAPPAGFVLNSAWVERQNICQRKSRKPRTKSPHLIRQKNGGGASFSQLFAPFVDSALGYAALRRSLGCGVKPVPG